MRMQITEVGPGDPEYEAVYGVYVVQGTMQWLARHWTLVLQKRQGIHWLDENYQRLKETRLYVIN